MALYTKVNQEFCISSGACQVSAPEVFGLDADGMTISLLDNNAGITEVPDGFIEIVMTAYAECPTGSIMLSNEPFSSANPGELRGYGPAVP